MACGSVKASCGAASCMGLEQAPGPAACADRSCGGEGPCGSGSGGDCQDPIGIVVSLALRACIGVFTALLEYRKVVTM